MRHLWAVYLRARLGVHLHQARTAAARGSSVVEWVIITAVIATVALGLIVLIKEVVVRRMGAIQSDW